jgi:hypothetical protein
MAALVEAPYEMARVELRIDDHRVHVAYECVSVAPIDTTRVPVLCAPTGAFGYEASEWLLHPQPA